MLKPDSRESYVSMSNVKKKMCLTATIFVFILLRNDWFGELVLRLPDSNKNYGGKTNVNKTSCFLVSHPLIILFDTIQQKKLLNGWYDN